MTITAKDLADGVGTGSPVLVYTVPINTTAVVKKWTFNNTTAGALTLTVDVNGGTGDRELLTTIPIAAKTPYSPAELNGITIGQGGTIKINAPAGVDYYLSGIEIV